MIGAIVVAAGLIGGTTKEAAGPDGQESAARETRFADNAIQELQQASESIEDVTASFRQIRHTPLLRRPLESRGRIHLNDEVMVWETEEPHRSTMSVSDEEMRIYYPDDALLEIYPLSAGYAGLNAAPLLRPQQLLERFDIQSIERNEADASLLSLHLSPTHENLRRRLASVVLDVEADTAIVRRGEMTTPDGERTEVHFADVQVNTGRQIDDVTRDIPSGTDVVRPASDRQGRGDASG